MTLVESLNSISDERLRNIVEKVINASFQNYEDDICQAFEDWIVSECLGLASPTYVILHAIYCKARDLNNAPPGAIIEAVEEFATYVNNLYYQRFWPLIGSGYTRNYQIGRASCRERV